jgi:hypothetical protein
VDTATAAFVKQYCLSCHNSRARLGGLALDALDPATVDGHADVWEKVVRKLRTGMMPPEGAPKPPAAVREAFTAALETTLDRAAARRRDPGSPALHRLNRAEYANAIRDLLALDVDVSTLLPPDDSTAGFDNIADVLGVSPALIEGYVAAAAKISRLAMGDPTIGLDRAVYRVPGDMEQDEHLEGLPLGTRGGIVVRHTFPLDPVRPAITGRAAAARPWSRAEDLTYRLTVAGKPAGQDPAPPAGRRRSAHSSPPLITRSRRRRGWHLRRSRARRYLQSRSRAPSAPAPGDTPTAGVFRLRRPRPRGDLVRREDSQHAATRSAGPA